MHQQDVPPNLANRLLTPFATRISVSFTDSLRYFPRKRTVLTGNPVREEILAVVGADSAALKTRLGFSPELPLLLVTGGSQGARHLNQVVVAALPELLMRCQVLHVSGRLTYRETSQEPRTNWPHCPRSPPVISSIPTSTKRCPPRWRPAISCSAALAHPRSPSLR